MTILGVKARNHPQQLRAKGADDSIDDRRTPRSLFEELDRVWSFTLDAAASSENAKCSRYFTRVEDGTVMSWARERVWCNPPYSHIEPWVTKAWNAMRHEHCHCVVMLLPHNRTEQGWWQTHVEPYRDQDPRDGVRLTTRFLPGRIRFGRPQGAVVPKRGDRPPFGLVLLTWRRS